MNFVYCILTEVMFDRHGNVTLHKYSELGRGKFGIVRLVEEKETLKHFAAKCIKTRKRVINFVIYIAKFE